MMGTVSRRAALHITSLSCRALQRETASIVSRAKVNKEQYSPDEAGLREFIADVVLMCGNCRAYNAADAELVADADGLQAFAESRCEERWQKLQAGHGMPAHGQ